MPNHPALAILSCMTSSDPHTQLKDFNGIWYYDTEGRFHRVDGPAVEYLDGTKIWFYHGKYIHVANQIEYERYLKLKAFW